MILPVLVAGLAGCAGIIRDRIFQPVPITQTPVTWESEAPQSVTTVTEDGLTLQGYFWPGAPGNTRLLIAFQGNSANQLVNAARVEPFRNGGNGVLVASYRGYGGNPGRPSEEGVMRDAAAWMSRAKTLAPGARHYVFGHSLGGAVAMAMGGRHPVAGVATLGTFSSMSAMVPPIARPWLRDRFDNTRLITKVSAPIFLYHGTEDRTIPFAAAETLRGASGGRAVVVPLPGGDHHVPMDKLAVLVWANFAASEAATR
ncbi:alpha/beta hydrolase [Qipengyuania sediminis]|uniref:alpha/beta hydrolase n=1 Tax=Qipengyuania sediminis TaxID=1532023 RepID=UPI0014050E1D|nr:alpha/beta hydrolase [Qipengyuania sediminis]